MSIENSRYTLSKNGDNIILTDKRDKKTRILTADDIDYVVDDNQKLRDVNIIENYFKLKEEPYEPKLITKTADLKREYEQAEKQYKAFPQDLVEQFIKRFKLNPRERHILGEIPEESTFKKFTWKTEEQQREMVNAFRELKKDLKEKEKISTDIFTYLKAYFKNYVNADDIVDVVDMSLDAFLKDEKIYDSKSEYEKISSISEIKNLDDVKRKTIKFLNINLTHLDRFCKKIKALFKILNNNNYNDVYFIMEKNAEEILHIPTKYYNDCGLVVNDVIADNVFLKTESEKTSEVNYQNYGPYITIIINNNFIHSLVKILNEVDESSYIDVMDGISDLGLKYFDSAAKIKLLMKLIDNSGSKRTFDIKLFGYYRPTNSSNYIDYNHIDFFYSQNKEGAPNADFIKTLTKGGRDKKGKNYVSFLNLLKNTIDGEIGKGEYLTSKSVGMGWTDKTLTRIENIQDTLRNIGSGKIGSGWTDKTLTRIEEIENTLRNV